MAGEQELHIGEDQLELAGDVLRSIGQNAASALKKFGERGDSFFDDGRMVHAIEVPDTGQTIDISGPKGHDGPALRVKYKPSMGLPDPGLTTPYSHDITFDGQGGAKVESTFSAVDKFGELVSRQATTLKMDAEGNVISSQDSRSVRATLGQLCVASDILQDAANGHPL